MRTLLIVCLAATLFAQPSNPPTSPRSGEQPQSAKSQQPILQGNPPKPAEAPLRSATPSQTPTPADTTKSNDEPENRWWKYLCKAFSADYLSNWILAFFALVAARIGLKTLSAIEVQARAASAGLEAARAAASAAQASAMAVVNSERAWVVPENIKPPNIQAAPGVNSFAFDLVNRGKTVARLTSRFKGRFCSLPQGVDLDDTPDYGGAGSRGNGPIYGRILIPDERGRQISINLMDEIGAQKLADIEEGRLPLYAYVSLIYFDAFDVERELQFGYMYWPKRNREPAKWVAIDKPQYNKHT